MFVDMLTEEGITFLGQYQDVVMTPVKKGTIIIHCSKKLYLKFQGCKLTKKLNHLLFAKCTEARREKLTLARGCILKP